MRTKTLRSRLPNVGTTIFTVMSKLAADVGAINLSQGFPDYDCDPALVDAVVRHMRAGLNQYPPMQGVVALREAIAAHYRSAHGATYDPMTEVTVTSGATEAIFDAIASVVHPGDEVIVLEPCYDSYVPGIELNGGRPVVVSLRPPEYRIDWDEVRDAITPRTRLLMINTPHNPTASVITAADIAALTAIVRGSGLFIVSDEVYEHIIFDGAQHESLARYPELAARSFIIGSFGKTYHVTGWKVGYAAAPAALTAELRKVHQYVTFTTITPFQHALADFFAARTGLDELPRFFQRKRDMFLEQMKDSKFRPLPCRGTYFQLMDYSAISDLPDAEFAIWMTKEHGVASIPTSSMLYRATAPRVVRFCFAKKDETLERAAGRLRRI
jgi:methionine aminotransferase